MLTFIVAILTLFTLLRVYIAIMQAGEVKGALSKEAVLIDPNAYQEAGRYAVEKEKLKIVGYLIEYLLAMWWLLGGLEALASALELDGSTFKSVLFIMLFLIINYLVMLPLELYEKFVIDKAFGFSKMTPKLFMIDLLKQGVLFLLLGAPLVWLMVLFFNSSQLWWLWAFVLLFSVVVLINIALPLFMSLFNTFTPMQEGPLKERIEHLMADAGLHSKGVFVMDAGKRDSRLNAFFAGLGKSKRVVLFDTLLEKLNDDELIAVLGHELGHFRHGDILKNLFMIGVVLFLAFWLFGYISQTLFVQPGTPSDAGVLIALMILLFSPFSFVFTPIISWVSRRNEYEADKYGAQVGGREHLISALLKLVKENRHFPHAHPLTVFFYYTHPPILERLKALGYRKSEYDNQKGG